MRSFMWFLAGAIALVVVAGSGGLIFLKMRADGFSARAQPTVLESWTARQARAMALPTGARERSNPVADSPAVLANARAHWADHCAVYSGGAFARMLT